MFVVASAHEGALHRMPNPRPPASGSLVEIAWVLPENGGKHSATKKCADRNVSVGCAKALAVSRCPLPVPTERVLRLLDSRNKTDAREGEWIQIRSPRELNFLFCVERSGIGFVGDVKIGNQAEDALFFLLLNFFLGDFHRRNGDTNFRSLGGQRKGNLWNGIGFTGMQSPGNRFSCEARA